MDESSLEHAGAMAAKLYRQEWPAVSEGHGRALAELIDHPEYGGAWIVAADGEIAGYVVVTACYSLEFHGRFGLLDELFVEERWRGKGVGAAALAFVDEQCRARGWKAVRLEVHFENAGARELYQRSGYHIDERNLMTKQP